MENASKALIIAGAILISILIIAIGMYIYTSSTSSINGAIAQMDTQEIQAFNSQWSNYEGAQTGSQIKGLITQIIAHANTYQDEAEKVVAIYCEPTSDTKDNVSYSYQEEMEANSALGAKKGDKQENLAAYIGVLNNLSSKIQAKHKYTVKIDNNNTPLVRRIIITYN